MVTVITIAKSPHLIAPEVNHCDVDDPMVRRRATGAGCASA